VKIIFLHYIHGRRLAALDCWAVLINSRSSPVYLAYALRVRGWTFYLPHTCTCPTYNVLCIPLARLRGAARRRWTLNSATPAFSAGYRGGAQTDRTIKARYGRRYGAHVYFL
jgi:hypothetical protein